VPVRLRLLPGLNGTTDLFAGFLGALPPSIEPEAISYSSTIPQGYPELLEELSPPTGPLAVLGESFSGPLSILYAARYPEAVKALVLVGTFARSPLPFSWLVRPLIRPALFRRPLPAWLVRALMFGSEASHDEVTGFQACLRGVTPAVLARRAREALSVDVTASFVSLRCPVLYLAGARDRLIWPWNLARLRHLMPALEAVTLDAPHLILQRRPTEAAGAVTDFLVKQARTGTLTGDRLKARVAVCPGRL
jgi:pimeloyl-[acyl-carrier protein] methyl ester esterase